MDMERVHNTALAIAAEFRPAGHESGIVDDAEDLEAVWCRKAVKTPNSDVVLFRDLYLYAEEGRSQFS